jgi:hypothetical protein
VLHDERRFVVSNGYEGSNRIGVGKIVLQQHNWAYIDWET